MKDRNTNKQKTLAERLLSLRKERSLTQAQVAEQAGITVSAYKGYELATRMPGRPTAVMLAHALQTSAAYLFGETDDSSPDMVIYPASDSRIPELIDAYERASDKDKAVVDTVLGLNKG